MPTGDCGGVARTSNKLGVKMIAKVTKTGAHEPGRHADGDGLFLQVEPSGKASWYSYFAAQCIASPGVTKPSANPV
jgi:hypothetical protein